MKKIDHIYDYKKKIKERRNFNLVLKLYIYFLLSPKLINFIN